jgi:hypothetical protein
LTTQAKLSYGRQQKHFRIIHPYFSMLYDAEHGRINIALCGDIMPSRRLAVFSEPNFLGLRGADACFANLESMSSVTAPRSLNNPISSAISRVVASTPAPMSSRRTGRIS